MWARALTIMLATSLAACGSTDDPTSNDGAPPADGPLADSPPSGTDR